MILFIDDTRKPEDIYSISYRSKIGMKPFNDAVKEILREKRNKPEFWHYAKSYEEAIKLLSENQYELIFFDHQLSDYPGHPTGYHIAEWIVSNLNYPFAYCSHSAYADGRNKIESLLATYHKKFEEN